MRSTTHLIAAVGLIAGLMVGAAACEISVWNECRTHNTFVYCWRLLSK